MTGLHIIFDGTDSTFKIGNKDLNACVDMVSDNDTEVSLVCHPITNIPQGKNGTLDVGYFIVPSKRHTIRMWQSPIQ